MCIRDRLRTERVGELRVCTGGVWSWVEVAVTDLYAQPGPPAQVCNIRRSERLARLEELGGEEEVRRAARHAFREIEERFTAAVDGRATALQDRTRILARVLDEAGYAGTLRHFGAGLAPTLRADQVCQGHCPFQ